MMGAMNSTSSGCVGTTPDTLTSASASVRTCWSSSSARVSTATDCGVSVKGVAVRVADAASTAVTRYALVSINARIAEVLAGRWYVNVMTIQYPDGEIRGQILPKK